MAKTYETLMNKAVEMQTEVASLKTEAGGDTSKRLVLEECYSALGTAIKSLVMLTVIYGDERPKTDR